MDTEAVMHWLFFLMFVFSVAGPTAAILFIIVIATFHFTLKAVIVRCVMELH